LGILGNINNHDIRYLSWHGIYEPSTRFAAPTMFLKDAIQ
jgi:hypothetical protein